MTSLPVILVSGIAEEPTAAATIALQWDLPRAVVVHHEVDVERQVLIRTVSDASGLLEREEVDVAHACVTCAIREDVLPTMARLADLGRWSALIARLPLTAEPLDVCRVVAFAPLKAGDIRVAACLTALSGEQAEHDLLGDDLVSERELPTADADDRGIGEIACAMVEYADVVVTTGELPPRARDLLRSLARPDAALVESVGELDSARLLTGLHQHGRSEEWISGLHGFARPGSHGHAWTLHLRSARPFHPERLRATVRQIGGGPHRSRGCFWLPTRPGQVCEWTAAGGLLSIGATEPWGRREPYTRIVLTGLDGSPDSVRSAFEACLLTDQEIADRGRFWEVDEDGFEHWLGPIRATSEHGADRRDRA